MRKDRFGWCLYDWANSAFATTILAAVLPVYFAESVVPAQGARIRFLGFEEVLSATSLWGYASGLTSFVILLTTPVLGGIADFSRRKKLFLTGFCYLGCLFTALLFFSEAGDVFFTLLCFCAAHYCFVAGNVFYDAFLPFLARGKEMDRLSGQGYALGYLGGGLLLALNVVFIQWSEHFGIQKSVAVRLSLTSAGLWWALFATISFALFREDRSVLDGEWGYYRAAVEGWHSVLRTTKEVTRYRNVGLFLVAYMIYNDGVQTVIKMASIYGKEELGLSMGTLLGTLLMVQFVGIAGALLMPGLAVRWGTKRTIMGSLLVWCSLTLFAYRMETALEYGLLGFVVGLILGGTQALSRSLYGRIIPREQSAQFYGYFSVFAKLSAIWGPMLFAYVRQATGTARLSILSISGFFLVGWLLLFLVKEEGRA